MEAFIHCAIAFYPSLPTQTSLHNIKTVPNPIEKTGKTK
jgi:hypothetical protein